MYNASVRLVVGSVDPDPRSCSRGSLGRCTVLSGFYIVVSAVHEIIDFALIASVSRQECMHRSVLHIDIPLVSGSLIPHFDCSYGTLATVQQS